MTERTAMTRCRKVLFLAALSGAMVLVAPAIAGPEDQGAPGELKQTTPCQLLSTIPGEALGIHKRCPPRGSSTGIAKGDFNGDGIADLAIGIPHKDAIFADGGTTARVPESGAVQIIYGTADRGLAASGATIPSSQLLTAANPLLAPTSDARAEKADTFGSALAAGDFNGDGFSDLAVALPGRTVGALKGAVMIFLGTAHGLIGPRLFLGPDTFLSPANPNPASFFAANSLTWGDFDGDGVGDLAVASTATTPAPIPSSFTPGVTVLFGVPRSGVGVTTTGKLHFDATPVSTADFPTGQPGNPAPSLVLTAGDFNADGIFDLVAASPFENATGTVHVLYGVGGFGPSDCVIHSCVLQPQLWKEGSDNIPGAPSGFAEFGQALAAGDFNGDGAADLAIGAPGDRVQVESTTAFAGSVTIIYGSTHGLVAPLTGTLVPQRFNEASTGILFPTTDDHFGAALAANDFNGDGHKDLAIGAPGNSIQGVDGAGAVAVIFGSPSGLSTTAQTPQILFSALLGVNPHTFDRFGQSLTAWNFGRSTQSDLAIGVPFADVGTATDAGLVFVVYGSPTGLTGVGLQSWTENSPGLNNSAVGGDNFGLTLY